LSFAILVQVAGRRNLVQHLFFMKQFTVVKKHDFIYA